MDKMTRAIQEKQKLLNSIRRLGGQVDAVERALDSDEPNSTGLKEIVSGPEVT
jgi:DNA-binding FrmR family transcriptional regulator